MTNVVLGYRNLLEGGSLSGGSWQATLPLQNLMNRTLGRVARSTNLATANATFSLQQSTTFAAIPCQVVALVANNMSYQARVRIRATTEGPKTNQALKSEKLDDAAWTLANATITANATGAPDGTTTADFLNETAVNDLHSIRSNAVTKAASAQVWTTSIYVRPNGRNFVTLRVAKNFLGGSYQEYVFDLVNKTATVSTTSGAEFTAHSASISQAFNSAFLRISITGTWASTVTSFYATLFNMSNSTTTSYLGVVGQGVYAWGLQHELGALSSYYPSDATPGSRPYGYIDNWQPGDAYDNTGFNPAFDASVTQDMLKGFKRDYVLLLSAPVLATGWRFDFFDSSNPDGYIQLGRVFIGPAWTPNVNMQLGASLGWEANSEIQEALSNAEYYLEKPAYRVARFTTPNMNEGEAFGAPFDLQRRSGITKEVVFMWAAVDAGDGNTDGVYRLQRCFYGRLRQLSPIEAFNVDAHRTGWEVKELL